MGSSKPVSAHFSLMSNLSWHFNCLSSSAGLIFIVKLPVDGLVASSKRRTASMKQDKSIDSKMESTGGFYNA